MNTQWMIDTHGDPLGAVRMFVHTIWKQENLDGMLVTMDSGASAANTPQLVEDPARLAEVNPFKPLMTVNAAKLVPHLLEEHPHSALGVLLRPCEMRALTEMVNRQPFPIERLLTIAVDCLGTFPADEYQWRSERSTSPDRQEPLESLTQEALHFARQGGIVPYRYRASCQFCASPQASGAALNLHVLGLPVRQHILVDALDEAAAERYLLPENTAGPAHPLLTAQHEHLLARLSERHKRALERVLSSLSELLPADVDTVVHQLDSCDTCQSCMNVCPICSVARPQRGEQGCYSRTDILNWLVSCAGCGMCEQFCPRHLPLSAIFTHIHQQVVDELGYVKGWSPGKPLPL